MTKAAELPEVIARDRMIEPERVPRFLRNRLDSAGLLQTADVHRHLAAGTLLELEGIGQNTLRTVLAYFTDLGVDPGVSPGGPRPGANGPVGFGPRSLNRKVSVWGPLRDWLVSESEDRGLPRTEVVRRCVALLGAVARDHGAVVTTAKIPTRGENSGNVLETQVRWPRNQWATVIELFEYFDTTAAGIMRVAVQWAFDHPEHSEVLDTEPELARESYRALFGPRDAPLDEAPNTTP